MVSLSRYPVKHPVRDLHTPPALTRRCEITAAGLQQRADSDRNSQDGAMTEKPFGRMES